MAYGKLRIPYVSITFVPYAISCIFFKGMSYGTNKGGLCLGANYGFTIAIQWAEDS